MGSKTEEQPVEMEQAVVQRESIIIRTSIVGIAANLLLAAFKAAVGILSNSIAVVLDAVNNLSDALSSIITIIGAKLANRLPDKKHPLGHGRVDYLSALVVSAIVMYAGITSFTESVKKIIHPETPDYSVVSLIIIGAAVVIKFLLGKYVKGQGEKVHSGALVASGEDASSDALLSLSVFACALIFMITGISLEAYVGVVISVMIIKAAYEMMTDTLDDILGHRPDAELTTKIKRLVAQEPAVRGAYDLFINNYGPEKNIASIHVELPDTMTVEEVDNLTRRVQGKVLKETGVILTGVGVYSFNTKNDEAARIRNRVMQIVMDHEWALQLHGFYVDTAEKTMRFDVVMSFDIDPREGLGILQAELDKEFPDFEIMITPDVDISE